MTVQILDIYYQNKFDVATAERELNTGTDAVMIKGGQGQYQTYDDNKCTHIAFSCERENAARHLLADGCTL